jgi:hypothetical protein
MSNNFVPRNSCHLWDHGKYGTARQATDDNMIRRLRLACWVTKASDPHSDCIILIVFPRRQLLRERASMLQYMYFASIALNVVNCYSRINLHVQGWSYNRIVEGVTEEPCVLNLFLIWTPLQVLDEPVYSTSFDKLHSTYVDYVVIHTTQQKCVAEGRKETHSECIFFPNPPLFKMYFMNCIKYKGSFNGRFGAVETDTMNYVGTEYRLTQTHYKKDFTLFMNNASGVFVWFNLVPFPFKSSDGIFILEYSTPYVTQMRSCRMLDWLVSNKL